MWRACIESMPTFGELKWMICRSVVGRVVGSLVRKTRAQQLCAKLSSINRSLQAPGACKSIRNHRISHVSKTNPDWQGGTATYSSQWYRVNGTQVHDYVLSKVV